MKSMTGYGEARGRLAPNRLNIRVEVRSVNNRFLNLKLNLPDLLSGYENDIEDIVRQYINRGAINFFIKVFSDRIPNLVINRQVLRNYHQELKSLQKTLGLRGEIPINVLINLPGVLEPMVKTDCISNKEWHYIVKIIKQALDKMVRMRQREGGRLSRSFKINLGQMFALLDKIEKRIPFIRAEHELSFKRRLQAALEKYGLNKGVPSEVAGVEYNSANKCGMDSRGKSVNELNSLERSIAVEVALFAQRSDINEELKRLSSHISEFKDTLKRNNEIGKKLDFITQEMLREVNTIGSKSTDAQVIYAVIALKGEVEKIKEQVQNIE